MIYGDLAIKGKDFFKEDADAIAQKMELLLSSHNGDWFFNRDFDCDLRKYLFEPYESWVIDNLKFDLKICFAKHIPEVTILDETDLVFDPDTRSYYLKIVFKINGLNNIYNFNYKFNIIQ
jgi:phage baseplate assembly protein W